MIDKGLLFIISIITVAACSSAIIGYSYGYGNGMDDTIYYYIDMIKTFDNTDEINRLHDTTQQLTSELLSSMDRVRNGQIVLKDMINYALEGNKQTRMLNDAIALSEMSPFEHIAADVAREYDYKLDVFDCTEFSMELARRLKQSGWNAKTVITTVDCDSGLFDTASCRNVKNNHMIVCVPDKRGVCIESTSGKIIHPNDYEAYGLK